MTYVDYIWQHQWISGEIVPCFLVRQLSVQQKLSISEDNLKIRNDLKNKEHIKKKDYADNYFDKVLRGVLARWRLTTAPIFACERFNFGKSGSNQV